MCRLVNVNLKPKRSNTLMMGWSEGYRVVRETVVLVLRTSCYPQDSHATSNERYMATQFPSILLHVDHSIFMLPQSLRRLHSSFGCFSIFAFPVCSIKVKLILFLSFLRTNCKQENK